MGTHDDAHWREVLAPEQHRILREKGTERAFSGAYVHTDTDGVYHCGGCDAALFASSSKVDSGSGWPSFTDVMDSGVVAFYDDLSHGMRRIEVQCSACGGHLGHVFEDGPPDETGLRYCINSAALRLDETDGTPG